MSDRDIIKIAISPDSKQAIDDVCDRYGMSQIEMASRLYMWFADQDEVLQAAVLGILPKEVEVAVAKMVLERVAEGQTTEFSPRRKRSRRQYSGTKSVPGKRSKKKSG